MRLREAAQQALEALIWTTGSEDFSEGGQAREGALNLLFPAITSLRAALSDDAMQRLTDEQQMIERGTKAWAGVPDATAWVENLRGNEPVTDCHGLEQARAAAASNLLAHFGITSADSDVNVAYLNKQLDDLLTAAICCKKDGDNLPPPFDRPADTGKTSDHFPDAAKMVATGQESRQVEPVAYVNEEGWFRSAEDADAAFRATARPLYAAPPKREPLTVAEIQDVLRNTFVDATVQTDDMALIRAIERAHDIGEKK